MKEKLICQLKHSVSKSRRKKNISQCKAFFYPSKSEDFFFLSFFLFRARKREKKDKMEDTKFMQILKKYFKKVSFTY